MKRLIKSSAFTQQTNALDVDKHMYVHLPPSPCPALFDATRAVAQPRPVFLA